MIEQSGGTDKPEESVEHPSSGRGRTLAHALMTNRRQARRTETSTCIVQSPPGIHSVPGPLFAASFNRPCFNGYLTGGSWRRVSLANSIQPVREIGTRVCQRNRTNRRGLSPTTKLSRREKTRVKRLTEKRTNERTNERERTVMLICHRRNVRWNANATTLFLSPTFNFPVISSRLPRPPSPTVHL